MSVEALHRAAEAEARIDDDPRPEIRRGVLVVFAFFGVFMGWAAFAPLDAAIVAPGVVVVSGNRQTVQHRDGGVISALHVEEGQRVEQGALLIQLGAAEVVAQEQALTQQMIDLQMRRSYLRAEADGATTLERPADWATLPPEHRPLADQTYAQYAEGGAELDARVAGYRGELRSIARQESLLEEELTGMRQLAEEQIVPLTRVRALERALAETRGRRAELLARRAADLRQIDVRLAEIGPELVAARQSLERSRMRAPVTGMVVGLNAHTVGGVVRPGEPVMDIVPEGQALVVEAQIDPRDADELRVGLQTEVRITAFGGRNLPLVHGEIIQVSADRFTEQSTGRGYFIARVEVPETELARLESVPGQARSELRAGLPAEIVAPTRKRTALQYLIEPLNQALWRAFRET